MDESVRKPYGGSRGDLKKRLKERNKKWTGLWKAYEPSCASASGPTGSLGQLRSIKANNRALALALQEERDKERQAQEALLYLKGENQYLKLHIFYLQTLLQSRQEQAPAENVGMFPSVPITVPVVTGREHCVDVPQHIVECEDMPESEMETTTHGSLEEAHLQRRIV